MKKRNAWWLVFLGSVAGCAGGDAPLPDPGPPLQSGITYNCGLLGGTYKFSKSPASQTVKAGAPFNWTVTLENNCTLPILNLAITDPVPDARVTGVDESGSVLLGCAATDHNVTCGSLSNVLGIGNDAEIAIHARAPLAAGTTTNTAAMSGLLNLGGILGILSVASVTETVTVIVEASSSDFTVDATFAETGANTAAPVNFGDDGRFTITVNNPSTGQTLYAGLVRIAFQVSPLFNNVSIGTPPAGFSCTRSGRTVTCVNTADIPPDTTRVLTVDVEAGNTAGVASSTVTVLPTASGLVDPDLTDNTKTIDVTIESPAGADLRPGPVDMAPVNDLTPPADIAGFTSSDLVLTKFAGQSCVTPLGTFGYVLSISNNGPNAADKVQIVDDLPFNIGGCAENNPDWDCPNTMSGSVVCTKNTSLEAGGTSVLALTCVAGIAGSIAANHATASHAGANFDPNLANNEATSSAIDIQLVCSGGDLKNADLELTGTQPACVLPSSSFDYELSVKNNGGDAANAARVTMTLPPGVMCAAPSGWDCSTSTLSGPVNCISTQSMPSGVSRLLHLACVAPSALTTLVLTANANHADFTTDTTPGNNSLTLTRAMTAACGLSVSAHLEVANAPVESVEIGQSFTYVITVSNTLATGDLTDVTVEDTYPTTGTLGTLPSGCTEASGKITCAIPTLGSTPVEIEIPFTAPAAPTVITSTITVASPSAMDPDTADNTIVIHSDVIDPNTGPRSDVAMIKDDSDDPVIAGTEWTYDFTVTTNGPNMARQFTITDTLPATTSFAGSTSEGWTCVGTTTVVCTYVGDPLIPGATSALQLKMQVANPSAGSAPSGCPSGTRGKLTNTATLAVTTPTDAVPSNNTDVETTCVVTTDHANEAPIQLWGGSSTFPGAVVGAEDTPLTLTGANALTITDPDVVESAVEVTITITNGTITLNGTAGLTFSAGDGTADATVTMRGTLAAINAALEGATITPNPDFAGAMSIAVTTNDLGKTGSGGPQSDSDTATVDVVNANDPPVINPDTFNVLPDSTDNVLDVLANDSDPDGDTLTITDVGTPSSGTISISSDGGTLIYTPEPGFVGTVTVTYTVSDGTVEVEATLTFTVSEPSDMADAGTAPDDMASAPADMGASVDMTPGAGGDMTANNGTYYNIAGGGLGGCAAADPGLGATVGLESTLVGLFSLGCALLFARRRRGR